MARLKGHLNIPTPRLMAAPRSAAIKLFCLSLLVGGLAPGAGAQQQSSTLTEDTAHGIQLYRQGENKEAIKALRSAVKQYKEDATAWYYLGLALSNERNDKDARKAYETALKFRPDLAGAHAGLAFILFNDNKLPDATREAELALRLDKSSAEAHYVVGASSLMARAYSRAAEEAEAALQTAPNFGPALLLKTEALIYLHGQQALERAARMQKDKSLIEENEKASPEVRLLRAQENVAPLRQAAESLERYLGLQSNASDLDFWREQLTTLRYYVELANTVNTRHTGDNKGHVVTKALIQAKPEPEYTDAARKAGISGTVILRATFDADGKVKHILVVQPLSHGLTGQAVKAARGIKFKPATKDGRPVSQFIQIEYNFIS